MKPYDTIPFTNEFGQVIQPGQSCVVITKGRSGSISRYKGRYLGVRVEEHRGNKSYQVVAEVDEKVHAKWHPETGKKLGWNDPLWDSRRWEYRDVKRITNLYLNHIYPSDFA